MRRNVSEILLAMQASFDRPAVISDSNPFKVLIATVLSQRTRDQNTALASAQLFAKYDSAKKLSNAPLAEVMKLVKPAGFYKVKAKRVKQISKDIIQKFQGQVPSSVEELLSLPGVGRKTANCVLVYGFGKPAMPVDVHVHRISNRIGLVETKKPEQTELALMQIVPKKKWVGLNHLMVRYGQNICLPRKPKCNQCKIRPSCRRFSQPESKKQV